jgi:hypothetical protein
MTIQRTVGVTAMASYFAKMPLRWGVVLLGALSVGLGSCAPQPSTPSTETSTDALTSEQPPFEPVALQVDEFTIDEVTGAGCSMTLMRSDRIPEDRTYIFFNPMQPENTMQMRINGEMRIFERTQGVGNEFYGQFESQTFINEETETTVQVDVRKAAVNQMDEGFEVEGTLRVGWRSQEETLNVKGGAGC